MNGTQFKMTEGDKSTVAVFNGPALNAKYNHLAFYPWTQQKAFTNVAWAKDVQIPGKANGTKGNILSYTASGDADVSATNWVGKVDQIVANIPATQEYYPGTFGNGVVPAISTRFDIAADGSADVSMQPVADYLFVDIMSVEPIKELKLQLLDGSNGHAAYTIAGENALTSYLLADGSIRYYMGEPATGDKEIKLVTNERAPEVSCHAANTYVFVVPAGILGMGKNVEAILYVNGKSQWTFGAMQAASLTPEDGQTRIVNSQLNFKKKDESKGYVDGNIENRKDITGTAAVSSIKNQLVKVYNKPLENTYFYMNSKNSEGEIVPFVYNPNNTFIIEHEGHLLQYLTEYGTPGFNKKADGKVDALICAEHEFDFSEANITALSDQKNPDNTLVYAEFEEYFAAYLGEGGTFPVINGTYTNKFIGAEHNGETPVIEGIYQPLAGANGIFGTIGTNGSISKVTFSDVVANTYHATTIGTTKIYADGLILGSMSGGSISDVTVKNAKGLAILGNAGNAAYNALTVENAAGLGFIALNMDLTAGLEIKNWDAVSAVKYNVFGTLDAVVKDNDYHHVVKLPATANYADLAAYVATNNTTGNFPSSALGNDLPLPVHAALGMSYADPVAADQDDDQVVSVLVGDTSIWTGDKFDIQDTQYMDGGKVAPAKYSKATDVVNGYKVNGWYKIDYAEQAASGGAIQTNGVLQRNMDMSYAVNPWEMVTLNHLEGNDKTIKGIHMHRVVDALGNELISTSTEESSYATSGIAPLNAQIVTNLTVDGVKIDIYTPNGKVVPAEIAGLALNAVDVQNVTVKNLVITGDGANKNNEEYADDEPVFIGWLVANTVNPWIINSKVEGVNSTISGIAGLVGKIDMNSNASSHPGVRIENSSASVTKMAQTALAEDVEAFDIDWGKANVAGTTVGYIKNSKGADVTVTLKGNGEPSFIFYSPYRLNVSYNGSTVAKTLQNYYPVAYYTTYNPAK
ncbi:MAG: hypothetical protein IJA37_02965 [Alistipes sp.]|nr:hypothetical protein [Alistipes sp.]